MCTANLTFNNSTFCPHNVFVCFVWIWEQTAIISLYNINWLVCITETECVYCAVRTGSLYIIQVMCFVWIWEQTAIISLYSINWLVCLWMNMDCVVWGKKYNFICNIGVGYVVGKVTFGQVFPQYCSFPLSLPFHQCCILIHIFLTLNNLNNWRRR